VTALLRGRSSRDAVALLEPFGTAAFAQTTEYWTPGGPQHAHAELTGVLSPTGAGDRAQPGLPGAGLPPVPVRNAGRAARKKEKLARWRPRAAPAAVGPCRSRASAGLGLGGAVKRTRFEMAQVFKSPGLRRAAAAGRAAGGRRLWFSDEIFGTPPIP
jgi:hypothetical protein